MLNNRHDGRGFAQLRPVTLRYDIYGYAGASLLFEIGNTKVLVSVSLQQTVPPFLKGQRVGWLSAEYAMLPCATQQRTQREVTLTQRNPRSVEISRLIGRCLRTVLNLNRLGERSVLVDCDVLQADGGTRVASIIAASMALEVAIKRWAKAKIVDENVFKERLAAISVGLVAGQAIVDLDYEEDKDAEVDFNFVMTQSGKLVEIQGTCEKTPISLECFENLKMMAVDGIKQIFVECSKFEVPEKFIQLDFVDQKKVLTRNAACPQKLGMFSLSNRLNKAS